LRMRLRLRLGLRVALRFRPGRCTLLSRRAADAEECNLADISRQASRRQRSKIPLAHKASLLMQAQCIKHTVHITLIPAIARSMGKGSQPFRTAASGNAKVNKQELANLSDVTSRAHANVVLKRATCRCTNVTLRTSRVGLRLRLRLRLGVRFGQRHRRHISRAFVVSRTSRHRGG
jgi:hypothetical protein